MTEPLRSAKCLTPANLRLFLIASDFVSKGKWGKFEERFAKRVGKANFEVLVPSTKNIRDYEKRVVTLIYDLAAALDLEPDQIVRNVDAVKFDVFRIAAHSGSAFGSVEFSEGITLFESGYELVASSATVAALDYSRPSLQGRRPDEARDFLRQVRMGQTEVGSFVLTLLLPIMLDGDEPVLPESRARNFSYRVVETLGSALNATERAVRQASKSGPDAFWDATEQGVTSNFCNALATMLNVAGDVSVRVDRSALLGRAAATYQTTFNRRQVEVLTEGARLLSDRPAEQYTQLVGTVIALREASLRRAGTLVLRSEVHGEELSVKVPFQSQDRDTVIDAFKNKISVQLEVSGTLAKVGNQYVLRNPHDFSITGLGRIDRI